VICKRKIAARSFCVFGFNGYTFKDVIGEWREFRYYSVGDCVSYVEAYPSPPLLAVRCLCVNV
jgi:hypothetical protein